LATTGADQGRLRRVAFPLFLAVSVSCVSGSVPTVRPGAPPSPRPGTRDPEVRVGLAVGVPSASIGGGDALIVYHPDGSRVAVIPAGQAWQVSASGNSLTLTSPSGWISPPMEAVTLAPSDLPAPVRINGRTYRGLVDVLRDRSGLTLINRVGMEGYLQGVVSAEMGRRSSIEEAALRAQAVVSRTYAMRNLGRWRAQGFDLTATVSDQVYGGLGVETLEGRAAVADTRGQVLTYNGSVIEAFFYSTCGGRTADGFEVFRGAARPYLRSVPDQAQDGSVYCSISPRYRWREEWNTEALRATLQRNLPAVAGIRGEQVARVTDVRITRRTRSGRVDEIAIALGGPEIRVEGLAIRQVLRPPSGELLRSNAFTLLATGGGRLVTQLTVDGMGSGHGVGFCQWGAVGRARAGQGYEQILAAYFPGTKLERRY
jgi:stage II sporulation protein D (peptidoglycan lytic transglycosylase)